VKAVVALGSFCVYVVLQIQPPDVQLKRASEYVTNGYCKGTLRATRILKVKSVLPMAL